ncbi:MAG TPA: chromophore lyase CpcT/CpeT [Usitatibacter sp.]|nr:chromophore lyase CpcT/CpeT [Usitatibacter sp.]
MKTLLNLLLPAALCACASASPPGDAASASAYTDRDRDELGLAMYVMPGTFVTINESRVVGGTGDHVRIRHARFWSERRDEGWIYAEYAPMDDDAHPFRQRIYRVRPVHGSNGVVMDAFAVPDAASHAGEWRQAKPFAGLSPASLHELAGCRMRIERQMEMVLGGGTAGNACHGGMPAVDHERWEFQFTSSSMRTWERGLDATGKPVSGPDGAWEMRRISQQPQ